MTQFSTYNINKRDFLTIVQEARKESISSKNIESAWKTTGLISYNPGTVLKKLESKAKKKYSPIKTHLMTTPERQSQFPILQTPGNVDKITQIDDFISQFCNQTLDTLKLYLLFKIIKRAKLAMADRVILTETNAELYKTNIQKKNMLIVLSNNTTDKALDILG